MKKKVLFVTRSFVADSPVGVRNKNFISYLSKMTELKVLNMASEAYFYKNKGKLKNFTFKLLNKLPWLPDIDILILRKYKRRVKQLLKENQFDTILIGILPFSFLLLVKYIKKINPNINIIVDLTDPITVNMSFPKFNKLKQWYLISMEKKIFPMIDTLVVLNPELKSYYEEKYPINNIVVIEQGIEVSITKQAKKNIIDNKVRFTYIGALYEKGREPFELYNAIEQIGGDIILNIYGGFKKKFIPPERECFFYGGRISREKVKEVYTETDVIVFIDNQNTLQVPGKTLEVLALNKPVLFVYYDDNSPTLNQIKKIDEYVFITKNNKDDIVQSVKNIMNIAPANIPGFSRDISGFYWENLLPKIFHSL